MPELDVQNDYNERLITLAVITLSGFKCILDVFFVIFAVT